VHQPSRESTRKEVLALVKKSSDSEEEKTIEPTLTAVIDIAN
jgi:hypothetical protein